MLFRVPLNEANDPYLSLLASSSKNLSLCAMIVMNFSELMTKQAFIDFDITNQLSGFVISCVPLLQLYSNILEDFLDPFS